MSQPLKDYPDGMKSLEKWVQDHVISYQLKINDLWIFLEEKEIVVYIDNRRRALNSDVCTSNGSSVLFNDSIIPLIKEFIQNQILNKKPLQRKWNF